MQAFHAEREPLPLPAGHPFPRDKYGMLREAVTTALPGVSVALADPASDGELALAHDPAWIAAVAEGRWSAAQQRAVGLPWSPALAERARRSVGATVAAARAALFDRQGVAAQLGGGTHHAHAGHGAGYCVFNDVAVAARLMQAEWHRVRRAALRVLVIDLDVHQGDGTATIFAGDPSVCTLSLHGLANYPARKARSDVDVALPDGCGDADYLAALDDALARCEAWHAGAPPGLAFYLAGADVHADDRLGRLKLSARGIAERDRRVLAWLVQRRVPVTVTMAGGYGRDLAATVAIHCRTLREAQDAQAAWNAGLAMEECRP